MKTENLICPGCKARYLLPDNIKGDIYCEFCRNHFPKEEWPKDTQVGIIEGEGVMGTSFKMPESAMDGEYHNMYFNYKDGKMHMFLDNVRIEMVKNEDDIFEPVIETPSYLNEGEELWGYDLKLKQYEDLLHVGCNLEEYELREFKGFDLIGFAVEDGAGSIEVMNSPHWFTGKNGSLVLRRTKNHPDKAKITGAVMFKAKLNETN
jgi:hypothetical protein